MGLSIAQIARTTRPCTLTQISASFVPATAATLGEPPAEAHLEAARLLDPLRDRAEDLPMLMKSFTPAGTVLGPEVLDEATRRPWRVSRAR